MILALYRDKGLDFLEDLSGIFAFALYDVEKDAFLIARDPIGVIPFYIGFDDADGKVYVASEISGAWEGVGGVTGSSVPGSSVPGPSVPGGPAAAPVLCSRRVP